MTGIETWQIVWTDIGSVRWIVSPVWVLFRRLEWCDVSAAAWHFGRSCNLHLPLPPFVCFSLIFLFRESSFSAVTFLLANDSAIVALWLRHRRFPAISKPIVGTFDSRLRAFWQMQDSRCDPTCSGRS